MTALLDSLSAVTEDLHELNRPFALIGGLAVSLRAEPRFTRDADLVVSVGSDADAELIVNALLARGTPLRLWWSRWRSAGSPRRDFVRA